MMENIVILICLLCFIGCKDVRKPVEMPSFDYTEFITETNANSKNYARIALFHCVKNWEIFNERSIALKEIKKNILANQKKYLVIEIGYSAFADYNYFCIWDNNDKITVFTNLEKTVISKNVEKETLNKFFHVFFANKFKSDTLVIDGEGYFITAKDGDKFKQEAIYSPTRELTGIIFDFDNHKPVSE